MFTRRSPRLAQPSIEQASASVHAMLEYTLRVMEAVKDEAERVDCITSLFETVIQTPILWSDDSWRTKYLPQLREIATTVFGCTTVTMARKLRIQVALQMIGE
jgi:hypothetical protein